MEINEALPQHLSARSRKIRLYFAIEWETVLENEENEYCFPGPISDFMNQTYKYPAIYRWNIFKKSQGEESLLYIGQTTRLCPGRLINYLAPRETQETSRRISQILRDHLFQNYLVRLEMLRFDELKINSVTIKPKDLHNKDARLLIEQVLISFYKGIGSTLLNL